jgi:hypothetical protein
MLQYCYNPVETPAYVWARSQDPNLHRIYSQAGIDAGHADYSPAIRYRAEGYEAGYDAALAEGYLWILASAYLGWTPVNREQNET